MLNMVIKYNILTSLYTHGINRNGIVSMWMGFFCKVGVDKGPAISTL